MEQTRFQWGPERWLRLGRGPLATEEALLRDLERRIGELGSELLRRPLWLVVPSSSLRRHLVLALLRRRGRAVAGLECHTLHGLAVEIVARADGAPPSPDLLAVFTERLAAGEEALERGLGGLNDGYAAVVPAVRDLLEAGLEPAHREALEEALAVEGRTMAPRYQVERAAAIVRVAAAAAELEEHLGLAGPITLLRQATEVVRTDGARAPCAGVFVYGFNDATGVATDLLLALLERWGGAIYLDEPPDPAAFDAAAKAPGRTFTRRFRERVGAAVAAAGGPVEPPAQPRLTFFQAIGGDAEVRECGRRIRALLDGGAVPERIGLVARQLGPYVRALRTQLGRLAIPFSALATEGPQAPAGRRLGAWLELLRRGDETPVERWLEAMAAPEGASRPELVLALHAAGAGRLAEAARLDLSALGADVYLPARGGFGGGGDDGDPEPVRARRLRFPTAVLRRTVRAAADTAAELARAQRGASGRGHRRRLAHLLFDVLGWDRRAEAEAALAERLGELDDLPEGLTLAWTELVDWLSGRLEGLFSLPVGGAGAGVQVLDVIAARSLTFDHLFLIGLNRGSFPRAVREDPLFPDALRHVLGRSGAGPLPDLSPKLHGFDEERYLFAQLMAAAPRITLSWQEVDDEHVYLTPSPLVERVRLACGSEHVATVPAPFAAPGAAEIETMRPLWEAAVYAGLHGTRADFASLFRLAAAEGGALDEAAAAARLAVLEEFDPGGGPRLGELGPYFGFVGPASTAGDPRTRSEVYVTTLERVARCPWQTFVERVLRVEPLPDPLEALPGVEALWVGAVVHAVMEHLVESALDARPADLEAARAGAGGVLPWPGESEMARAVAREASELAHREGVALTGFAAVLARVARDRLEAARRADFPDGESRYPVLAAEIIGHLERPGPLGPRRVAFRADRVDRLEEGLLLTDYKTGRGPSAAGRPDQRAKKLLDAVAVGEWLQAMAYAVAAGGEGDRGRYLFLHPEIDDELRETRVAPDNRELRRAFEGSLAAALAAWDLGAFFPLLVEPRQQREPRACTFCDVAEACLRGDSGARGRLLRFNAARDEEESAADADESAANAEQALRAIWRLAGRRKTGGRW